MTETVYISGPMTGYMEHNYPTFHRAAAILWDQGFNVLNPAEHFDSDHDRPRSEYLRADIKDILTQATAICLLPGWHESPGAVLEVALAYNIGIHSYLEIDFENERPHWVGYLDHVERFLPWRILPAHATDAPAPAGEKQPTWWKYRGAFYDPTGKGASIVQEWAEAEGRAYSSVPEEDELTKTYFVEDAVGYGRYDDTLEQLEALGIRFQSEPLIADVSKPRIIDEAWGLVMGDRQASYGHPASDFTAMGIITSGILGRVFERLGLKLVPREDGDEPTHVPPIPPADVALISMAVKLSREAGKHKHDNLVDLIGYTVCKDRIEEGY